MQRSFSVMLVFSLLLAPAGNAQIINGGFDSDLSGWITSTGMSVAVLGEDGVALFDGDPSRTAPVFIEQTFTLLADQDVLSFEFGARDGFLDDSALTPPGVFAVFLFDEAGDAVGTADYQFGVHDAIFLRDFDVKSHSGGPLPFNFGCLSERWMLTINIDLVALAKDREYTLKFGAFDGGDGILETYLDNVRVFDPDFRADPSVLLSEDFEGYTPGPWVQNCDWGNEWTELTSDGITGISVRNIATTWEKGKWAGWSERFGPMFGRIEFDVVVTVPVTFGTEGTVVKFQADGSLALFDYAPAVFSWIETTPGLWAPAEPITFAVETFANRREIYVDNSLVLSGLKDESSQGIGHEVFVFRYGSASGDNSETFGPGSLTLDNLLVTCDAASNRCINCLENSDCDDSRFCNGFEVCVSGRCQEGTNLCPRKECDEISDRCILGAGPAHIKSLASSLFGVGSWSQGW